MIDWYKGVLWTIWSLKSYFYCLNYHIINIACILGLIGMSLKTGWVNRLSKPLNRILSGENRLNRFSSSLILCSQSVPQSAPSVSQSALLVCQFFCTVKPRFLRIYCVHCSKTGWTDFWTSWTDFGQFDQPLPPLFSPLLPTFYLHSLISSSHRHPHFSLPLSPPPLKSLQTLANLRGDCWRLDPLELLHHLSTLLWDFRGRFHRLRYCLIFPIFDSIHTVLDYLKYLFKDIV
jgi:hypothetical protein